MLVVIHYPDDAPSSLARILTRSGPLPAHTLGVSDELAEGTIGVGPPGRHVLVLDGHAILETGPRENGQRPSIDVLFRSAAQAYGARAIGIVVSGTLDDGTLGLAEIAACGGRAIVQDPADADDDSMPLSAIRNVAGVEVASAEAIGTMLAALDRPEPARSRRGPPCPPVENEPEQTRLSCPDCGGPLAEIAHEPPAFRCRVGHAYTIGSLSEATERAGEAAVWSAIRNHDERVDLLERLGARARTREDSASAETYLRLAEEARVLSRRLRSMLEREPVR